MAEELHARERNSMLENGVKRLPFWTSDDGIERMFNRPFKRFHGTLPIRS
jgi:hypothetical protein